MATRTHRLGAAAAVAVAGAAVAARALWFEPRSLEVRRVAVHVPEWPLPGLRIAVVSDLHAGAPHVGLERVEEVVQAVAAQKPDLVALLGDYADPSVVLGRSIEPDAVAAILGRFDAPLGTVGVLGNHDWEEWGERVGGALRRQGIRVLENEAHLLGDRLWVLGLADPSTRRPDLPGSYAQVPDHAVPLVLSHDPDLFPWLPDRPQLVLSGHTHGAQVDLPGIRARWVPSRFGDRYTGGLQRHGVKQLYVSRGIGTSRLPVRFRARPEVAILTVHPRDRGV